MNLLDTRTVLFSYIVSDAICAAVMTSLWLQNHRRSTGLGFWLADFSLQLVAVLLIALRGLAPDFVSILLGNLLVMGGTLLLYMGLERYTGQPSSQRHNYLLLAIYIFVHAYFTFAQPSLSARNISFSVALLVICSQCAWLLLRRVPPALRPDTRLIGMIFGAYSLVSLVRIFADWMARPMGNDLLTSGLFDTLVILAYQMLFIALTFGLFLMVNRRLLAALEADIVERKAAEAAIKKSEEKFSKAFQNSPDAVTITSMTDGKFIQANEGFFRLAGLTPEEIVGKTTVELNLWESPADRDQFLAALQKTGRVQDFEATFTKKTGELLRGWISGEALQLPEGPCVLTVIHNVTELRLAEERLNQTLERLELATRAAHLGIWDWDISRNELVWDDHMYEIFGVKRQDFPNAYDALLAGVHPDDRAARDKASQQAQRGEREYDTEFRILWPDGTVRVLKAFGQGVRDAAGQALRMTGVNYDITESKEAEKAQQQSEFLFRALFELSPDAVVLIDPHDPNVSWPIVDCNAAACLMNGYRRDELIGHSIDILNATPGTQAERIAYMKRLREAGILKLESFHRHKSGTMFPVEVSTTLIKIDKRELVLGIDRDITERKRAEVALDRERRLLRTVIDNVPDQIFANDRDGCFILNNRSDAQIFGVSDPETLLGKNVRDFCPPELAARFQADNQQVVESGQRLINREEPSLSPEGSRRWVLTTKVPLRDGLGQIIGLVGIARDITERKEAEEALKGYSARLEADVAQRTRELRDAQAQLVRREKLAVLGQMSGGVAHELRQPLAVISNAVYFLRSAQPDAAPAVREYLGLIAAELQTADHIVTDLLSFARSRAAEKEPAALAELVEQALARNPAPPGVAVQVALPPSLPPVYVDPRQLGQVLNNLITNAYQAMPRGGQLTLTAALAAAPSAAGFVTLAVADTGDGIAAENMLKLFEPLFTTKSQGIGLGLTITKMLVEANGGTIEVTSETGRGATFHLTLPMKGEPV